MNKPSSPSILTPPFAYSPIIIRLVASLTASSPLQTHQEPIPTLKNNLKQTSPPPKQKINSQSLIFNSLNVMPILTSQLLFQPVTNQSKIKKSSSAISSILAPTWLLVPLLTNHRPTSSTKINQSITDSAIYSSIKSIGQTPLVVSSSPIILIKINFFRHVFRQPAMIKLLDLVYSTQTNLKPSSLASSSHRQKGINY